MEALGDEFPRGAVGEEVGGDQFLIGRGRRGGGLGFGVRLAGGFAYGAGGFRRGDEAEIVHAQSVCAKRIARVFLGTLNHGRVIERFAPGGLVEVERLAEKWVWHVADRASAEALVVQENAEEEDF